LFSNGREPVSEKSYVLEELVVTARRRSENIQDTPISITAFSAEGLAARNVVSLDSIANFTPSLSINGSSAFSGSSQTVSVFMRGIGQTDFTMNTDPGVGIYVDGVYLSRSVGALLDLVDVERLEVLHGPQGTLFGRNSVGGAINITSTRPADDVEGKVYASVGSDDWYILGLTTDLPINEDLKTRLSIQKQDRDGYIERDGDGKEMGDKDNLSARLSAVWNASESLEVFFSADYTRSRENGVPLTLQKVDPGAAFAAAHNIIVAPQLNPDLLAYPSGCLDPEGAQVGGDACYNERWISDDESTTFGTYESYSDVDVWGASATITYDLSPSITFKSITAYRDLESEFARDGDGSPLQINSTEDIFDYRQWSEEIQLSGTVLGDKLNYIIGGFYFDEKGRNPNIVDFGYVRFLSGGDIHNTSVAVFGQADYNITDYLTITGGLRYTDEKKRFTPEQRVLSSYHVPFFPPFLNFSAGDPLTTTQQQETDASELTPHVNLAVRPDDNSMYYISYSRGFKSGGYTQRIFPALETPPSFDPETVDVIELGFKLDLLDRRLRLNGAAYYTWYEDLQITVPVGVAPTTQNAAEASIKGFELEALAMPFDDLTVSLGIGYTDAQYDELDDSVSATITRDNMFPGTSEWTANASVAYERQLDNGLVLTPRLDWSYRSEFFFDAENFVPQDDYQLINLSLNLVSVEQDWSITLFSNNIADEEFSIHGEQILDPAGFSLLSPARGREWGLRVEKGF